MFDFWLTSLLQIISLKMLFLEKYYQNCQACFGRSECEWVKSRAFCCDD